MRLHTLEVYLAAGERQSKEDTHLIVAERMCEKFKDRELKKMLDEYRRGLFAMQFHTWKMLEQFGVRAASDTAGIKSDVYREIRAITLDDWKGEESPWVDSLKTKGTRLAYLRLLDALK